MNLFSRTTALAPLVAMVCACAVASAQQIPASGSWTLQSERGGLVNFEIRIDTPADHSSWGSDVALSRMPQLSRSALDSSGSNVRFDVVRDAGTLQCTGYVANGSGGGTFRYVPNPHFASELEQRGISAPSADDQRRMTYSDVSLAFVDVLHRYGYSRLSAEDLIRLTDHGVTGRYVTAIEQDGYHADSAEGLVRMVDHGVTADFISAMRGLGYRPSAEDLVRLIDHGVTPDFTRAMIALGYHPTADQLVRLADHGVTAEFVKHLRSRGYSADIDQLIRLKDAGI